MVKKVPDRKEPIGNFPFLLASNPIISYFSRKITRILVWDFDSLSIVRTKSFLRPGIVFKKAIFLLTISPCVPVSIYQSTFKFIISVHYRAIVIDGLVDSPASPINNLCLVLGTYFPGVFQCLKTK